MTSEFQHSSYESSVVTPLGHWAPLSVRIGARDVLARTVALLEGGRARLLTIIGGGGIGKSRLLGDALAAMQGQPNTDIFWIDAERCSSPEMVLAGIDEVLHQSTSDDTRLILAIDPLDHFLEIAPALVHRLMVNPHLQVVSACRRALNVRGEKTIRVQELPLPDDSMSVAEASAVASVALFMDRVGTSDPTFVLNDASLPAVVRICRRLEGVPLALELAAGRTRLLPVAVLADVLDQPLEVLQQGPRDVPDRSRSMRANVAWSYDVLSEESQRVFRLLSVFPETFAFPVASALVQRSSSPAHQGASLAAVLEDMQAISLVRAEGMDGGVGRFALRWDAREFGLELLRARGEERQALDVLREVYLEDLYRRLDETGPTRVDEFAIQQEPDAGLVRHLLTSASEPGEIRAALPLMVELWRHWGPAGQTVTMYPLVTALIDALPERDSPLAVQALTAYGNMALDMMMLAEAETAYEQALEGAVAIGDGTLQARASNNLGLVAMKTGRYEVAADRLVEALDTLEDPPDPPTLGKILGNFGDLSLIRGEYGHARTFYRQSFEISIALHDRPEAVRDMFSLMVTHERLNDSVGRDAWFAAGMELCTFQHDARGEGRLRLALGRRLIDEGDLAEGLAECLQALELFLQLRSPRILAEAVLLYADICYRLHQDVLAARALGAANWDKVGLNSVLGAEDANLRRDLNDALGNRLGVTTFVRNIAAGMHRPVEDTVLAVREVLLLLRAETDPAPVLDEPLAEAVILTKRELEVLQEVAAGLSDREVAESLHISPGTARTHVANILAKLGVHTRGAAAARALRLGLIRQPEP